MTIQTNTPIFEVLLTIKRNKMLKVGQIIDKWRYQRIYNTASFSGHSYDTKNSFIKTKQGFVSFTEVDNGYLITKISDTHPFR